MRMWCSGRTSDEVGGFDWSGQKFDTEATLRWSASLDAYSAGRTPPVGADPRDGGQGSLLVT